MAMTMDRPTRPRLAQIATSSSYTHSYSAPSPSRKPNDSDPSTHTANSMRSYMTSRNRQVYEPSSQASPRTPARSISLNSPGLSEDVESGVIEDNASAHTPRRLPSTSSLRRVSSIEMTRESTGASVMTSASAFASASASSNLPYAYGVYSPFSTPPTKPRPEMAPRRVTSPLPAVPSPTTPQTTVYKTHRFAPFSPDIEAQAYPVNTQDADDEWSSPLQNLSGERRSSGMSRPTSPSPPASPMPLTPYTPAHRVVLGGIVSTPGPGEEDWDEKQELSIEVPGIVLTEPHNPTRIPSPPPKHILLLPPTSLTLPIPQEKPDSTSLASSHLSGTSTPSRPGSPTSSCGLFARRPSLLSLTSALSSLGGKDEDDLSIPLPITGSSGIGGVVGVGGDGRRVSISASPSRVYSPVFADLINGQTRLQAQRRQTCGVGANTLRTLFVLVLCILVAVHFWMDTLVEWGNPFEGAITTTAARMGVGRGGGVEALR